MVVVDLERHLPYQLPYRPDAIRTGGVHHNYLAHLEEIYRRRRKQPQVILVEGYNLFEAALEPPYQDPHRAGEQPLC